MNFCNLVPGIKVAHSMIQSEFPHSVRGCLGKLFPVGLVEKNGVHQRAPTKHPCVAFSNLIIVSKMILRKWLSEVRSIMTTHPTTDLNDQQLMLSAIPKEQPSKIRIDQILFPFPITKSPLHINSKLTQPRSNSVRRQSLDCFLYCNQAINLLVLEFLKDTFVFLWFQALKKPKILEYYFFWKWMSDLSEFWGFYGDVEMLSYDFSHIVNITIPYIPQVGSFFINPLHNFCTYSSEPLQLLISIFVWFCLVLLGFVLFFCIFPFYFILYYNDYILYIKRLQYPQNPHHNSYCLILLYIILKYLINFYFTCPDIQYDQYTLCLVSPSFVFLEYSVKVIIFILSYCLLHKYVFDYLEESISYLL
ncbi:hypothetical protein VP01_906g2 [Puccinia sorghi]|uniref:Uncharacterized protein n=1 Tax=Puccinia sorghi TaxID=27349 RepID=A0A0L6U8B3_9BASI|nr:hypothetical protein VP01_906g2 [Puccinia sorghi]